MMFLLYFVSLFVSLLTLKVYGPSLPVIAKYNYINRKWVKFWVASIIVMSFIPVLNFLTALLGAISVFIRYTFHNKIIERITNYITGKGNDEYGKW